MEFKLNLGMWNNVFAVPTSLVDNHLKTAGHKQLQILLYMLKNADKSVSIELLAKEFNMHQIDVKDCLLFWENEKVLIKRDSEYYPVENIKDKTSKIDKKVEIIENKQNSDTTKSNELFAEKKEANKLKKARGLSRPQKPDMIFVSSRIKNSEELQFLMVEAESIMGKPLSNSDFSTLVMLHDVDGLPIDVIIMILQFSKSEGKAAMRYIESIGIDWASEDIDTLEKAERKIAEIQRNKSNWEKISKIFGIQNTGTPTKLQIECGKRWLEEWKYSSEMIRLAYEISVDTKGVYNLKYIDGIIKRWRKEAIQTKRDYDAMMENKVSNEKKNNNTQNEMSSFNLDSEKQTELFDI